MKDLKTIFLLSMLALTSYGCAKQKGNVSLKVSSSFAIGSAGYTGGLYISGKSSDGKTFSATASTGSTITLSLNDGTWTINVVGWEGTSPFLDVAHCGSSTITLSSTTKDINISANPANCSNPVFTANKPNIAATPEGLRKLNFYSCKALYQRENESSPYTPVRFDTADTNFSQFCTASQLAPEFLDKAKSVRFTIPGDGASFPDITSSCADVSSGSSTPFRVPVAAVPFKVTVYEDPACSSDPHEFLFKDGLAAGSSDFDSVVNNQTSADYYNLFVPYNKTRRGYSALINLIPELKCQNGECVPKASGLPANYFVYSGPGSQEFRIPNITSCSQLSGAVVDGINLGTCKVEDNSVYQTINVIQAASGCSNASCSLTYGANILTFTSTDMMNERSVYDDIWSIYGNFEPSSSSDSFYNFFSQNDKKQGIVGDLGEDFSPGGMLSLFGDVDCPNLSGTHSITLFDEGQYQSFQVTAYNTTKAIPNLLCDDSDATVAACPGGSTFTKQIVARRLSGQQWIAQDSLFISCSAKIGMVERQDNGVQDNGTLRDEKQIIGWNTQDKLTSRVEKISYEKQTSSNGATVISERTEYERGQNLSDYVLQGQRLNYEYYLDQTSGAATERINQRDFYTQDEQLYSFSSSMQQPASAGSIFSGKYFNQLFNTPYLTKDSNSSTSPDGLTSVKAWIMKEVDSNYSRVRYATLGTSGWNPEAEYSSPLDSTHVKTAAGTFGKFMVAWKLADTTDTILGVLKTKNAGTTTPFPSTFTATDGGAIDDLDVCMEGDVGAVVWTQNDGTNNRVQVAYVTGLDSGTPLWSHPSTISTDSVSPTSYNASKPKCAFITNGASAKLAITYILNYRVKVAVGNASAGYITLVGELNSSAEYPMTSGHVADDSFIRRTATGVEVSHYDTMYGQAYLSSFNGSTWTHQTTGIMANYYSQGMKKSNIAGSNAFNTFAVAAGPVTNMKSLSKFTLRPNFLGRWQDLAPAKVNGNVFMNATSFKKQ